MSAPQQPPAYGEEAPARFERIHRLEKVWMTLGLCMLVAFVAIVIGDAVRSATVHSHGHERIAAEDLASTPPFDKPGVTRNADGSWDAVVIAYAFGFLPREDLVVPVGAKVHFKVASIDVVHGFQIPGHTNVNLEVVPGHVSEVTQTFDEPGRFLILCHEYCGSGHHFMTGHIRVLQEGEDVENPPPLKGGDIANAAEAEDAIDEHDHEESA